MKEIFSKEITINKEHVNKNGLMRTSSMFTLLHDAADEHMKADGFGKERLIGAGLLWVIANQTATIKRIPSLNETVTIRTWLNKQRMGFFPRCYEIISGKETIITASAVWALMSSDSREIYRPENNEFNFKYSDLSNGENMFEQLEVSEINNEYKFTVCKHHLDINMHMNNARYFDEFDSFLPASRSGQTPQRIIARYYTEALPGESITCSWGIIHDDSRNSTSFSETYYITCQTDDTLHMKADISY